MRRTGIPIIGDVPWGTHFCQFYQDKQDLIDILVPYFKAGLQNNEFCMWVTSEPLRAEEAKAALAAEVEDLETYIRRGQFEILEYSEWYTAGGKFESDRVLQGWVDRLDAALARGFDGLRLTGNTFWLEKSDWQDFTDYEATVDSVIGNYRMLAICTYSLAKCGAIEIMDVVSNHAFALIKRAGKWQIIESAERKKVEASLRESEERLRVLGDNLPDSAVYQYVHELDGSARFVYCSAGIERINGVKASEVLRDPRVLHIQIPPEYMERFVQQELRSKRNLSDFNMEMPMRRPDGEVRWMRLQSRPRRLTDGRTVWDGVQTDITEEKKAEDHLRQSQKLESIGLLAGGIAHDFNNLLTGVMGNASLLLEDAAPERAETLRSIIASTERAAHLTRQLLAYSGKGQFIVRELDVTQAVNEMADLVQFSIPKSVSLALTLERRLPFVAMDPGQLQQILMNLVINAGEAMGDGNPGRITVTTSMADIQSPFTDELGEEIAPGRYVCIEVRDNGSGIDPEKKAKIFDPFFTTKFVGRGLGLAAIAGILRSQKGGIIVESALGQGSAFRVFLPAAGKAGLAVQEPGSREGRPVVLVIDDEVSVRDFISAVFRRKGYQVIQASDGQEALAVVGSAPGAIDAAIVDIIMPNMSAKDLLPALKAKQPGMRILLTSGYSEAEARRLCAAFPGTAFIQKPYTAQQLARAVDDLVGASAC